MSETHFVRSRLGGPVELQGDQQNVSIKKRKKKSRKKKKKNFFKLWQDVETELKLIETHFVRSRLGGPVRKMNKLKFVH